MKSVSIKHFTVTLILGSFKSPVHEKVESGTRHCKFVKLPIKSGYVQINLKIYLQYTLSSHCIITQKLGVSLGVLLVQADSNSSRHDLTTFSRSRLTDKTQGRKEGIQRGEKNTVT